MIIDAKELKKSYTRGGVTADVIRGIDLQIAEGEFVSIIGESGSGKSTLLYLLSGIEKPDSGKIVLLGKDLSTVSEREMVELRRSGFSFVYQFDNLLPDLTVAENVALPLLLAGKKPDKKTVLGLLEYMNVLDTADKLPSCISGGEHQRVAVARAVVTEPKLIFLDEPTGSLDAASGTLVMELLMRINEEKGIAVVQVTHSAVHAAYASRQIRIADGAVV